MDWQPTAPLKNIKKRAVMLREIRAFFQQRNVLEVDTPALSTAAISDPAIDSIEARNHQQKLFLQTSPELPMKRLLAAGSGDIYQICKVFRAGESGRYHNPEFTMLEWYRVGWDDEQLQQETIELIQQLAQEKLTVRKYSYAECFQQSLDIDPLTATTAKLKTIATAKNLAPETELPHDSWLDLLFSTAVITEFPEDQLTIIDQYPASQAALARLNPDKKTAARFEIFWGKTELANGYHELTDFQEQKQRFDQDLKLRQEQGLAVQPLDKRFIAAIEAGLPDCAGVALGLDRLTMNLTNANHIDQVISFPAKTGSE